MFEVEIKSLLGSKENADRLKKGLSAKYPGLALVGKGKQLNHYFTIAPDLAALRVNLEPLISADKKKQFETILSHGTKMSIRTRDADGKVIFVVKASVGDDTSSNGVKRMEFEQVVPKTLAELDQILLASGCAYQAKWSREREEYAADGMHICFDKNAGYGYLAEFEKVTPHEAELDAVRQDLLSVMSSLGVSELPQDRLERMFAHYNSHWPEYYGTERTFTIE
jgi:adenylate cyclase class IV